MELQTKWIYLYDCKTKYTINTNAEVYSYHRSDEGILLKPYKNKVSGYCYICLYFKHNPIWKFIHRLVAEAFIPIPMKYIEYGLSITDLEVNHIDGTYEGKSNNSVDNLEWVTSSENKIHAYKTNLRDIGDETSYSIYTNDQIESVCKFLEEGVLLNREIWIKTGVSVTTIQAILSGAQWKHISQNYDFSHRKKKRDTYSDETKQCVINMLKSTDLSFKEIGDKCGMTRNAVWYLNNKYSIRDK